jgi:PAS domain S-box-containing protein
MYMALSEKAYNDIFHNSQMPMLIIGIDAPNYTMLDVNNAYLITTNTKREDLIGKPVFGVFPANPTDAVSRNIERTIFSFEQAIENKFTHTMSNYRYDIPIPNTNDFEERYWTTSNTPVLNEKGEVIYFIHSPINVTQLYKLHEREKNNLEALKEQEQQLFSTFMQAPVGIAIFKGPEYIVDLINPPLCQLYGKTSEELMGKPVFEVLPHAKGMGFEELLDKVMSTGQSYKANTVAVPFERKGILETVHLNFVYEPFKDTNGKICGVIVVATDVTELVNAKNRLEEAEERARLAVDAVDLGTFYHDLTTGEIITSQQSANIFGFAEIISKEAFLAAFHPDDLTIRDAALELAGATGKLFYEARITGPDKMVKWIRVEGKTYYDNNKKATKVLGTILDITDQKKAKEDQRKLISLVENSVDLMSILNMEGTNSYINEAGKKLLGFANDDEVLNTPIAQLHTPEDFLQVEREVIPSVMNTGKWAGVMMVRHLKTGEIFPVYNNCFRIDDAVTGAPIAVGAVMRDMRPEQLAKKALADSEQLLRSITTAAPTALWMSDETGAITYVNQTWLDWTATSYEESLGQNWIHSIHAADREKVADKFMHDITNRNLYEAEFRIDHADGTIHWCIATGQPQYTHDGDFKGYIGACIDITEQKQLQQQKDDFIAIASHELKTPVTSIKGYAQILQKILEQKGDMDIALMMSRMDNQVNRLTALISDLLDVTKINSGQLQFNHVEFDLNDLLSELLEDLQSTTQKHTLIRHVNDAVTIYGDKERISQVITNLVTNAIKYSPYADKVDIGIEAKENETILYVQDYGIGIAANNLNKVFEQFYRVSGDMQHTYPGLGLGLFISAEIIKRKGGRIWVDSKEGVGSTFYFSLPKEIAATA